MKKIVIFLALLMLCSYGIGYTPALEEDDGIPGVFETLGKYIYFIIIIFIIGLIFLFRRVIFNILFRKKKGHNYTRKK